MITNLSCNKCGIQLEPSFAIPEWVDVSKYGIQQYEHSTDKHIRAICSCGNEMIILMKPIGNEFHASKIVPIAEKVAKVEPEEEIKKEILPFEDEPEVEEDDSVINLELMSRKELINYAIEIGIAGKPATISTANLKTLITEKLK